MPSLLGRARHSACEAPGSRPEGSTLPLGDSGVSSAAASCADSIPEAAPATARALDPIAERAVPHCALPASRTTPGRKLTRSAGPPPGQRPVQRHARRGISAGGVARSTLSIMSATAIGSVPRHTCRVGSKLRGPWAGCDRTQRAAAKRGHSRRRADDTVPGIRPSRSYLHPHAGEGGSPGLSISGLPRLAPRGLAAVSPALARSSRHSCQRSSLSTGGGSGEGLIAVFRVPIARIGRSDRRSSTSCSACQIPRLCLRVLEPAFRPLSTTHEPHPALGGRAPRPAAVASLQAPI